MPSFTRVPLLRAAMPPPRARITCSTSINSFWGSRAGLRTSAVRLGGLKEARDKEGVEHEIEHHKQDQLRRQKEGDDPHWKEQLASESESAVKADRGEHVPPEEDIATLQKKTVEAAKTGRWKGGS